MDTDREQIREAERLHAQAVADELRKQEHHRRKIRLRQRLQLEEIEAKVLNPSRDERRKEQT